MPYRSTGDLDLLGRGDPAPERMAAIFKEVCAQPVADDGLTFDIESISAESMRDDDEYRGVRLTLTARLSSARVSLQIDIGFGDAVTPAAKDIDYPSALGFPAASLRAYPPETVVAEKLEAVVSLGMRNTRMKDFFDLWAIAKNLAFDGAILTEAVTATFERRGTPLPTAAPPALTVTFTSDPAKQAQWRAFLHRTTLAIAPQPLPELIAVIAAFTMPLLNNRAVVSEMRWEPGGPWNPVGGKR